MDVQGKSAIISGGASGIGEAATRLFAENGCQVMIFDRNEEKGTALAEELGSNVSFAQVDVADQASVSSAVARTTATFGHVHIACNFAGIGWAEKTLGRNGPHMIESFTQVINVNLIGTFNLVRFAAVEMAKNDPDTDGQRGAIVNTASVAAFEGQVGQVAYTASKGGVVSMTLPMARDLGREGIRVNTIAPGIINTPLMAATPEPARQSLMEQPVFPKRLGHPEEIAKAALFLVNNDYINGETLRVDGGIRMQPR